MMYIAARELRSLFVSPLAWLILAVVMFLLARVFLLFVQGFLEIQGEQQALPGALGVTQRIAMPLFEMTAFILMVVVPMVTMRLLAGERSNGTLPLLLSSPVSGAAIVLGKFLGAYAFVLVIVLGAVLMPLSLLWGTALDPGVMLTGIIGLVLIAAAFTAIGLYFSSLTSQPTVAAITTLVTLLFLWWAAAGEPMLEPVSLRGHLSSLFRGVLDTRDIAYFVLLTVLALTLATRRVTAERSPLQ